MINLQSVSRFSWAPEGVDGFEVREVLVGPSSGGVSGFEVVLCTSSKSVTRATLNALHRARVGKRIADVAIACETPSSVWVFGPDAGRAPMQLSPAAATQQLQAALNEPDSVASYRRLVGIQDAQQTTEMPGVRNRGLFASYHLRENVPARKDWEVYQNKADALLPLRHRDLIAHLGYHLSDGPSHTLVLSSAGSAPRAVALLLEQDEQFEATANRFQRSPVAVGLSAAGQQGVPWLILVRSDQIRLYPARDNVGVGQKGQVETYLELDLASLAPGHAGLLPLVFSAESLAEGGVIDELLEQSARFATELGVRLRTRVYESFVPNIATEVAYAVRKSGRTLDSEGLTFAYQVTLNILFRLLFQAYGEDRGLLPAGRNEAYDANSLKTLGKRLLDQPDLELGQASSIWRDLRQVWDSIDKGNKQFELPAYNGGLFASDPERHPEGAFIDQLIISDAVMGPALAALLIDDTEDGVQGLVDFRSLSVREFGTIYEGLLESSLSVADQDLVLDPSGAFVPAGNTDIVTVRAGEPFFHNSSGERKATGSYFTPSFIVDHLVERTIDPTLDQHLDRIKKLVEQGKTHDAAKDFFDYRVADLAMGSGHFLVAAIDRIEAKMRDFLADPEISMPGVSSELERLAQAAKDALGRDEAAFEDIEQATLLRRQIARRCVYGLDINPLAVELSRLALWIHTFVPGLPMSTLDHNLVCGDSLIGIGTVAEVERILDPSGQDVSSFLFGSVVEEALENSRAILTEVANVSEATKAEVQSSRDKLAQAMAAAEPTVQLMDAAVAVRAGKIPMPNVFSEPEMIAAGQNPLVAGFIADLNPAHLPACFPEVFLRENPGFDAVLGNPPWDKIKVEEHQWWGAQLPGLRGLEQHERNTKLREHQATRPDLLRQFQQQSEMARAQRELLLKGPYEGLGKGGDPDLYQAFTWRNWQVLRKEGRAGVVLPRGALSGSSMVAWRQDVLENGAFIDVTLATNSGKWLFPDVDGRYTVAFAVFGRESLEVVRLRGPHYSRQEFLDSAGKYHEIPREEFRTWSTKLAFPSISSFGSVGILRKMQAFPAFGEERNDFEFRPVTELHATSNRSLFDVNIDSADGDIPVIRGASFGIWNPDLGGPYGLSRSNELRPFLEQRFSKGRKSPRSAYFSLDYGPNRLPIDSARIVFRDVTNATNSRTMIACLNPPGRSAIHKAPLLVRRRGSEAHEAYLLGVLNSIPFDWVTRRWVELTMSFEILNQLPVPFFDADNRLVKQLVANSAVLSAADSRFEQWASSLGVKPRMVRPEGRAKLVAENDALVALLFELSGAELEHIFASFQRGWDPSQRLAEVMGFYENWSSLK